MRSCQASSPASSAVLNTSSAPVRRVNSARSPASRQGIGGQRPGHQQEPGGGGDGGGDDGGEAHGQLDPEATASIGRRMSSPTVSS
jgi:hypothetical protein